MITSERAPDLARRRSMIALTLTFLGALLLWIGQGMLLPEGYTRQLHIARAAIILVGGLLLWMAINRWIDRRPIRIAWEKLPLVGLGALAYLLPAAVVGLAVWLSGQAHVELRGTFGELLRDVVLLTLLVLAFEAIPEELLFRDLMQRSLATVFGAWPAVLGQTALFVGFGAIIGAARTVDRLILFAGFAFVQGLLRMMTGTVAVTIGLHLAFQLAGQLLNGSNWPSVELVDPQQWAQLALIAPAIGAPLLVWAVVRRQVTMSGESGLAGGV